MRASGKITQWNAEKGYGFITPGPGARDVFVHISAFHNGGNPPAVGQAVSFELSSDQHGRACAAQVTRPGERLPREARRNSVLLWSLAAVLFMVFLWIAATTSWLPFEVFGLYLAASIITFGVYAWDKSAARVGVSRTPENTLHLLALVGGWPGALIAQQTLRHKTRKESFRAVFWMTVVTNCVVLAWALTDAGAAALHAVLARIA